MKHIITTKAQGRIYILLTIALGVISVNSANNLMYLTTTLMLGYMLASGLLGRSNIQDASVSVEFPDEIYAGVPCPVAVRVTNKRRFIPLFLIDVALREGEPRTLFPVIQAGTTLEKVIFTTFKTRGRATVDDIELSSVYPFNFFTRYWPVKFATTVTVFPFPLRCEPEAVFIKKSRLDEENDAAANPLSETDIVGVRAYTEGDSMKRIHWKSSARTGKLKSRLYEGNSSSNRRIIDLDRLLARDAERGLSMAAFTITEAMKSGLPVGMNYHGTETPPANGRAHNLALLSTLALHRQGGEDHAA